jgi:Glycosyl hydrolase family 26
VRAFPRATARLHLPVTALAAIALVLTALTGSPPAMDRSVDVAAASTAWGVYSGPGAKNVAGVSGFAAATGLPVTSVVDFPAETSWTEVRGAAWLLDPYRGAGLSLEYSLPLMPSGVGSDGAPWNLDACAKGAYDYQWTTLGKNLVAESLPTTVIRPGWEFNGSWYRWSAAGKVASFVTCFRHVVATMRAVPGGHFTFDWNPNLGSGTFPAEQAYPGDGYVDVIGVDAYDTSWTSYPTPAGVTTDSARVSAWNWLQKGDHGLNFWSSFARQHGKPMSITEWGATWRPDGHGGGDNPYFIDRMVDFISDPVNNVVTNHYFNVDAPTVRHDLTRSDTIFPAALAELRARAGIMNPAAPGASRETMQAPVSAPPASARTAEPTTAAATTAPATTAPAVTTPARTAPAKQTAKHTAKRKKLTKQEKRRAARKRKAARKAAVKRAAHTWVVAKATPATVR